MNILLQRNPSAQGATVGKISVNGVFTCYSLEDEIREVPGRPVAEWKIKGATAIPAGVYRITLETSNRFGPDTLTVNAVPGFTGVRIHAGNTAADTEGCPLLGMQATDHSLIGGTSGPAVALVKRMVRSAIDAGDTVLLTVRNP